MNPDFHVKNYIFYSKLYETAYLQELIHSIFSTLLSFTLTLLFSFNLKNHGTGMRELPLEFEKN